MALSQPIEKLQKVRVSYFLKLLEMVKVKCLNFSPYLTPSRFRGAESKNLNILLEVVAFLPLFFIFSHILPFGRTFRTKKSFDLFLESLIQKGPFCQHFPHPGPSDPYVLSYYIYCSNTKS